MGSHELVAVVVAEKYRHTSPSAFFMLDSRLLIIARFPYKSIFERKFYGIPQVNNGMTSKVLHYSILPLLVDPGQNMEEHLAVYRLKALQIRREAPQ
jgi:hypothetical protein